VCIWLAAMCVAAASVTLYTAAVWFGNLNQDEGWYLYAARAVADGRMPYRDFFFTQGPLMPYLYGLFAPLWSPHGVLGGRVFTAALGLLSGLLAAGLARRAVPSSRAAEAGLIAFALTACNLYHVYFTTIPKTYALASCLVLGGFLLLTLSLSRRSQTRSTLSCMWALPAGMLIAFAAGVRLSLGAMLPITALALLLTFRKTGAAFFWFALGGGVGLALAFGPTLTEALEPFLFSQSFHVARGGRDLFFMAGSLARTVRAYLPAVMLLAALVIFRLFRGSGVADTVAQEEPTGVLYRGQFWPWIWLLAFLAVFGVQLASPYPYDDYQVPVMGLLAAAVACWAANSTSSGSLRGCVCLLWVVASLLASFGSPMAQSWFVARQDRFWAVRKTAPDLAVLRQTARDVRALAGTDDLLLTQDTYLAVEAGMRVPEGLEMGPFSYFPQLSDEEAARYYVMNDTRLEALLAAAPASIAAYSGYGFAIRSPVMDEVPAAQRHAFLSTLGQHYDGVQEVPDFGQNSTTLQIMKRRTPLGAQQQP